MRFALVTDGGVRLENRTQLDYCFAGLWGSLERWRLTRIDGAVPCSEQAVDRRPRANPRRTAGQHKTAKRSSQQDDGSLWIASGASQRCSLTRSKRGSPSFSCTHFAQTP